MSYQLVNNTWETLDRVKINENGARMVQYINKTGANSIKGTLVHPSITTENAVEAQTSEFDTVGVFYEDGIADGELAWVIIDGTAEVLLEDLTDTAVGNWVYASAVDGRANGSLAQPPGGTITALTNHFKEVGHSISNESAGTDVLAKIILHFN